MRLALIIIVAAIGVLITIAMAMRLWKASRAGAPRELQLGYLAIMVAAGAVSLLLLRVL
ncbi:MAG: hypothetical protein JWM86_1895 [Thermoleophilia bacterium]|nr:hypothetical protein [Thermoleophilia bacterium]